MGNSTGIVLGLVFLCVAIGVGSLVLILLAALTLAWNTFKHYELEKYLEDDDNDENSNL